MDLNTQEVHLSHYWNVIYKRWKVALSIVVVVMAGTFLASYFSKPLYKSTIQIQIERENPNQLTVEDLFGIATSDQEFMQTQYVLLKSRGLADRVISDARLLEDKDFYAPGIAGKSPAEIDKIRAGMVGAILGSLDINPVRNTSLVEISYIAPTPQLAQKVAEAVGTTYMTLNTEQKLESVHEASDFLTRQITTLRADIEQIRGKLQKYGESKGIISANDSNNIVVQKLVHLNGDYTNTQNNRIEKQSAYDAIVHANPAEVTANDPVVLQLSQEEAKLQRDYNQKLALFKPEYPQMQSLRESIDKTHQARISAIQNSYASHRDTARRELEAAQQAEAQTSNALDQQKRETMNLNVDAVTLLDLSRTLQSKQTLLDQLEKRQNETEVTARLRGSNTSNIHWVDHAQLPGGRFNVTMKKNLQSAFPLGVVLGLAAIFFLEYMDRSIKTPEELERVTKFAALGLIPSANPVGPPGFYSYGYGR